MSPGSRFFSTNFVLAVALTRGSLNSYGHALRVSLS